MIGDLTQLAKIGEPSKELLIVSLNPLGVFRMVNMAVFGFRDSYGALFEAISGRYQDTYVKDP